MGKDVFAEIAAKGIGGNSQLLEEPKPKVHKKDECVLEYTEAEALAQILKSTTADELKLELKSLKDKMADFLRDLAPKCNTYSERFYITDFLLDGSQKITLPHYCGPIGNKLKVYEAEFSATVNADKVYYLCFDSADYYAVVYVNDRCVGTHEGFFAPFEFDVTASICDGVNKLRIELYNDYVFNGNDSDVEIIEGDKLYAATGPGWDDAQDGWHHCPAGMGICGKVYIEERNKLHISNTYVRPLPEQNRAELWLEVNNVTYMPVELKIKYSIYGQNFSQTVCEDAVFIPHTSETVGMCDSLTAAEMQGRLGCDIPMPAKHGINVYKIPIEISDFKTWEIDTPYLYQLQVSIMTDEKVCDAKKCSFGMRSFTQDVSSDMKGMFYLNGRKIRLRGANTMGFEQQDVMRNDIGQLIDDILLAKLCNMNFLRLTQRPVQDEVYEYCDKLGLMTQTDLPLFGCMRRTKICEGIRQAEEMERMVRSHPCNVIISYINEPFPNAMNEPHRHLERTELEQFFGMCDTVVKLHNPERVIKHVDGDYDPPTDSMPDNHCYPMWYNSHGIEIGRLNKGYWIPVKPNWYYGCGEYGTEGLDSCEVMCRYYPKEWIKEPFCPGNIVRAQTQDFHRFFYDTQESMEDWVRESQEHQRFATKIMTEAFRRDNRMVSSAIHLFIDAWPSGWMKAIMDCTRMPKPAYFAYRDALSPVLLSLRTDRFTYFENEQIRIETFVCNDTNQTGAAEAVYELYRRDKLVMTGRKPVVLKDCTAEYVSDAVFSISGVKGREMLRLRALLTMEGRILSENSIDIEVFEDVQIPENPNVIFINPDVGITEIAGERVEVKPCGMLPVNFVSRKTSHPAAASFRHKDFAYWYNEAEDMITPIAEKTFTADGFTPILLSGNKDDSGRWSQALVCAEKVYQGKRYVICTVDLRLENPVAKHFLKEILSEE